MNKQDYEFYMSIEPNEFDTLFELEQGLEMEQQAILGFLPEDIPGGCVDCDTCKNPCKQLQEADCG